MLKLLVIEDHALVREGLVRLLAQIGEDKVLVLDRPDFESALELLESEDEFDLILLDLALPGIDGFAGLDVLRRQFPAIPVAVVSAFDDLPTVTRVMNLGASGFIPKAFSGEALLAAVRQVLALMVRGLSNREIAEQLGLSEGTVKIHATAVFKALGVGSRTQALVAVTRYGIDFARVF